jgi:hypothetical protein
MPSAKNYLVMLEYADLFRRFELVANLTSIFKARLAKMVVYCALLWIRKNLVGLLNTTKLFAGVLSLCFICLFIGME